MGYTHYWDRTDSIPLNIFALIAADIQKLIDARPGLVCREYDRPKEKPLCSNTRIVFNGKGDDGHETFWFPRVIPVSARYSALDNGFRFQFCKTARKPYDEMVCACLVVIVKHASEYVKISSDGDFNDWTDPNGGIALVHKVLGRDYTNGMKLFGSGSSAERVNAWLATTD